MNITSDLLVFLNACEGQRDAFAATFPDGLDVTGEPDADAIALVVGAQLRVPWLCDMVLTRPAQAEYERVMAPVLLEHKRVIAPALAKYRRAMSSSGAEFVTAPAAWAEYDRVRAPAMAELDRARAVAAWRLLADDGNIWPTFRK